LSENAGSWISYSDCPWKLDNGDKVPEKKFFTNAKFNIADRCFSGTIEWGSTPFANCTQWVYNFTLAENHQTIESGTNDKTLTNGSNETSHFGETLNYTLLRIEEAVSESGAAE